GGALTFTLDPGAPSGASITSTGQFSWCPTEAQGPGVYPVTVRVTEDGAPVVTDAEAIGVTVNEVNQAPVLTPIGNKTIMAGNTLSFTATATDADLPANALVFYLDSGSPVFPGITSDGRFQWDVQANQAPGDYPITVHVTDNGSPALSDAETFTVHVLPQEPGSPVVTNPGNKTVNVGSCLDFTITATGGSGTLVFSLAAGAPSGATITSLGGQFHWCPTESQPGFYPITVNVSDGIATGSTQFTVSVRPQSGVFLSPIGDKTANEGTPLFFNATAITWDGSQATFSLEGSVPSGAGINFAGGFGWAPTEAQGPGVYPITVCATAGGESDCETFNVTVKEINLAPVLNPIGNKAGAIGVPVTFTAVATDADLPANTLTFSLDSGAPSGATIDPSTGAFTWTPATFGSFPVTVRVTDNGTTPFSDFETILIVLGQGQPPVLDQPANMTVDEGAVLSQRILGTDPNSLPLTFSKVSGPPWMTVETLGPRTGFIVLSPDFAAAGTYPATVRATNESGSFDQKTFTIVVTNICRAPSANAGGPYSGVTNLSILFDAAGSSDPDGETLVYDWSFGDGGSARGAQADHIYFVPGAYSVDLTATDPCQLTGHDATTATITGCYTTILYTTGGNNQINLKSGKSTTCMQVQPVDGIYDVSSVDLSSIVMSSSGTGSVGEIHAIADKTSVSGDPNKDGIPEVTVCFAKDDLRQLFSNLTGNQTVHVTVSGNLAGGGTFCIPDVPFIVKAAGGGNLAATITPNPLNPSAVLTFATQERGPVLVQLFDVRGRLVRTLRDENDAAAGYHDVRIDGVDASGARLSSGVYFVRIRAGADEERKAITILK
ncbi:MAG TPA: putative Ig domain-containing protein, partial [Candidatus Eisenbacteria bacterium]|nr:putative Ig domain-containing protein [Candidatus Eisenbacteria bacterium]